MRKTKIVATIGPASSSPDVLKRFVEEGVDVFRLNFSHGTREEHREHIRLIRKICSDAGTGVAIMQDLCGPKIRVGRMQDGQIDLCTGAEVTITIREVKGTSRRFSTTYPSLPHDVKKDARILLNDGAMALQVVSTTEQDVLCRVLRGGTLKSNKGMNLPGTSISIPSVTQKDMDDLAVGIEEGVDFVALSFVRTANDIRQVKHFLAEHSCAAQVIAKIEKPEAVECIDEIIEAADGILIARGDLGVEMDLARVPLLQKDIILRANEQDKYVIVATQMLESMMHSAVPTRAEVSDVTNAIIDGTDAVMLSGETAAGDYPVDAVRMMDRIANRTEAYLAEHPPKWDWSRVNPVHPVQDAIGHAAFRLCEDLDVGAIAAFSASGGTALFLSKSRPAAPIVVFTADGGAFRRMRLFWGVVPVLESGLNSKDELLVHARRYLKDHNIMKEGSAILLVAGSHFGRIGSTNGIEVAY